MVAYVEVLESFGSGVVMGARPTGTVTILFTDLEGSTCLWDEHPGPMAESLALHDRLLREVFEGRGGVVFASGGDGFAVAFQRASDAVWAAIEVQRGLQSVSWPVEGGHRVRIGLHTGETHERDGDYFGPTVNRAARIMAAAHGGQVVLSSATVEVAGRLSGVELVDLGWQSLRGVVDAVRVYAIHAEGVFGDVRLRTFTDRLGNLPLPPLGFVGRLAELQMRVADLPRRRLVTLTGPGGVGKTRLAVEVGWLLVDEFAGGVWLTELGSVTDPDAVAAAVAATLGVLPQPNLSLTGSVLDWLRGRRLLLILDNCEHVIGAAAALARGIVAGCPTVTVLATSREPLGVSGERVHVVPSLDPGVEATELFIDRARATDDSFVPSPADRAVIESICRRLDGIPLAIELAAARTRALTPVELLARLDDRFRVLRGSGRGGLERHQTLRATVSWSYQLLTETERRLFARLSVFGGPFALSDAEAVCADEDVDRGDVGDVLSSLVDKSMVMVDRSTGTSRFHLLETLRQYGEERLDEHDGPVTFRNRHLDHYVAVAEAADRLVHSTRQLEADLIFEQGWANLRTGLAWALAAPHPEAAQQLVAATGEYASSHLIGEHSDWCDAIAASLPADTIVAAEVVGYAAVWAGHRANYTRAIELTGRAQHVSTGSNVYGPDLCASVRLISLIFAGRWDEADELAAFLTQHVTADSNLRSQWWSACGLWEWSLGKTAAIAATQRDHLVAVCEALGSPTCAVRAANVKGSYAQAFGGHSGLVDALEHYEHGITLATDCADTHGLAMNLTGAASAAAHANADDAVRYSATALTLTYDTRDWLLVWLVAEAAAKALAASGDLEAAATIYGYLEAHIPAYEGSIYTEMRHDGLQLIGSRPDIRKLRDVGAAMPRDELIAFTLLALESNARATELPPSATPTEQAH